jgi:hypothetical protein
VPRTRKGSDLAAASPDASVARAHPVLRLQREIGNRATGQLLARAPAAKDHGTVQISKLPAIKVLGGNGDEWAARKDPESVDITSKKGKHSAALERLSKAGNKIPSLKLTTPIVDQSGQHLDFGSVVMEFGNPRITGYAVDGNVETWRAVDFETAHRTTISHKTGV